jgi:hypothetical protein
MRAQPVMLCIQDTTELDFNGQEIDGLGPLKPGGQANTAATGSRACAGRPLRSCVAFYSSDDG